MCMFCGGSGEGGNGLHGWFWIQNSCSVKVQSLKQMSRLSHTFMTLWSGLGMEAIGY